MDASGAAYITGQTISDNFRTTAGVFQRQRRDLFDGFVTKLSPDGRSLVYSTYLGGSSDDCEVGGCSESAAWQSRRAGLAYIGGYTLSPAFR